MTDVLADFMQQAIELSKLCESPLGKGHPKVGVVIVKDGEIVAEAFKVDSSHAEFRAIKEAKKAGKAELLKGATVYTTLEPCTHRNHEDKKPCAQHLIDAGIVKVVIGMLDNNPKISGKAVNVLKVAGIEVEQATEEYRKQIEVINKAFLEKVR